MEIKGIKYTGPIFDNSGYAKACRGNIMALYKLGVPLTLNSISFEQAKPELIGEESKVLGELANKNIDYNVNLIHTTPEFWEKYRDDKVKNVGYTVWETNKLHKNWPVYINKNVDKVLVACEWNVEVFKNSGVTIPIGVVQHGINMNDFDNVIPYTLNGVDESTYVFYSIFQWVEKKCPLSLLKAYWHMFQNNENVALVLKTYRSDYSDNEKQAIRSTIHRLKSVMPMDKYPPVYLILDMLSESEMLGLHARGDCYASFDRFEGFGLCVGANTKISIPSGIKLARRIKADDEVLSVDGKFHKVTATSSRYVKNALKISTKLHEDIIVSKEHPFLIAKNLTRHVRYTHFSEQIETLLSWSKASTVSVDDYIAIPKPKLEKVCPSIDITSLVSTVGMVVEEETLCYKMGFSPKKTKHSYKELVKKYGFSKGVFGIAVNHLKNNTMPLANSKVYEPYNILMAINYEIKKPNTIKRYISITDDVLTLFGWYLAEGSTNNDTFLEIDLHINEYDIAVFLSEIFKSEFNLSEDSIYLSKFGNKSRLIISSRIIATLFSTMFGKGAKNKHIPGFLFKCGKNLLPLVKGLFSGDGHNDGNTYALTTVSDSLAYQTKLLLNGLGFCPRLNKKKKGKFGNYDVYIVSMANNDYCNFISKETVNKEKRFFVETDNFFLVKIYKIEEIKYDDLMYDFSVEEARSFVGNGLLLHNSPFTAGANGKPIIVTGFGGSMEYAKEDNSYLNSYTYTPVFGMPYSPWHTGNQLWGEPDVYSGAKLMKHVYENQDEAKEKGVRLKKYISENFTWEHIGKKLIKELEML